MPRFIEPMLARSGPVPDGEDWALEVKFDETLDTVTAPLGWHARPAALGPSRPLSTVATRSRVHSRVPRARSDGAGARPRERDSRRGARLLRRRRSARLRAPPRAARSHGRAAAIASARAPASFLAFDVLHLDVHS